MEVMVFLTEQWLLVLALVVLGAALIVVEGKRNGTALTFHELTRLVNQGEAVIVDVRESSEYKAGHIVDAINIPHQKIATRATELDKHKSKTIVVVDKMGQHSGAGVKALREAGFNVSRMQGGMAEWSGQNLPVVKG